MTEHYSKIAEAITYLYEHATDQPDLEEVAKYVHMSPHHFQRTFSEWAGVSPKKFLQYLSLEHAKNILQSNTKLFDAAYETGLSGTSRLHDLFVRIEGMTPGEYKQGGSNLIINYSIQESIFGKYIVASTNKGICQVSFFDDNALEVINELKSTWHAASFREQTDTFQESVIRFFNTGSSAEEFKLHMKGTPFQLKVWEALLKIPQGELCSYQNIAQYIQQPNASRAVGTAIGSNPIAYIIPCHRVIKKIGIIGEYRWGSVRKKAMIGWEASKHKS